MEEKYKVLTDNLRWYDIYEYDVLEHKECAKGDDYFISPTGQRITPKIIKSWLRLGWIVEFTESLTDEIYFENDIREAFIAGAKACGNVSEFLDLEYYYKQWKTNGVNI